MTTDLSDTEHTCWLDNFIEITTHSGNREFIKKSWLSYPKLIDDHFFC